jgi:hypothetical protein
VCNHAVLDYLETVEDEHVRMTYRVTYDFGSPRSYQLIAVGTVPITWDDWLQSWGGCGGKYSHPCNSPQAQNDSHLYQSSWSGE